MAIKILLIPAISDNPERVFLGGRCIVLQDRIQIDSKTLKDIEYLKNQYQRRIIREIGDFSLSIQLLYSQGRDSITPYMPTYSYYNIRNIRNICSIRSICNICNIYRTLLITVCLVRVEKLRTGHFYPYQLRYFMHFLLDKGYFMLAYRIIKNHTERTYRNLHPRCRGPQNYKIASRYSFARSKRPIAVTSHDTFAGFLAFTCTQS